MIFCRRLWRSTLGASVIVLALACASASAGPASVQDCAGTAAGSALEAESFTGFWKRRGPGWTGGDQALSVVLGDGRNLWLYADTILGTVDDSDSRTAAPIVHNTIAIQDGPCVTTYHGGTAARPDALAVPAARENWFWPGAAVVDGDRLIVLLNEYAGEDVGLTGWHHAGNSVAVFSLADMSLLSLEPVPAAAGITWGAEILEHGGYTYIYGVSKNPAGSKSAHVARAPGKRIDAVPDWRYRTAAGWSNDPGAAMAVADGVADLFSVLPARAGFVLLSQDSYLGRDLNEFTSLTPDGPFAAPLRVTTLPDPGPGIDVYNAIAHPQFSAGGKLLIGYSVAPRDLRYDDASRYRPRFVSVAHPASAIGPRVDGGGPPSGGQGAAASGPPANEAPAKETVVKRTRPGTLKVIGRRLRSDARGRVRVTVSCTAGGGSCRGRLTLTAQLRARSARATRAVRLGSARVAVRAGGRRTVVLRVTRRQLAVLRRQRRARGEARLAHSGAGRTQRAARVTLASR